MMICYNSPSISLDWNVIDTVLLDMDGTLLDLHFDTYFWLEHLPKRYAEYHQVSEREARTNLHTHIESLEGSLNWYCLDYWSEALGLEMLPLKKEIQHKIALRPHTLSFLRALQGAGKKAVLITNAHPAGLQLKLDRTAIDQYLDVVLHSHQFGFPKEEQDFWQALSRVEHFDPARTLFIDDGERILRAAQRFGIAHVLGIHQPDSQVPRRMKGLPAIDDFDEILPIVGSGNSKERN